MTQHTPRIAIGFMARPDVQKVDLFLTSNGIPQRPHASIDVSEIGNVVALLLSEAIKASDGKTMETDSLEGVLALRGVALGLSQGQEPGQNGLVIHAGKARLCIQLNDERAIELGRVLMTARGNEGRA